MSAVVVWGDFEVDLGRRLGRGGMGAVYRARQVSLDRPVAVKVLDPAHTDEVIRAGLLQKFQVEIRALSRLNDPRIVAIYQAGENDGRLWFAMELVDGRTLDQRLSEEGAIPEAEARRIAAELALALDAALRQGIIHRDVKPANVFLGKDGAVKLGDFGLARSGDFAKTRITEANALACTPAYASPEQAEGRECDHRSDLYSLGAVLYEMVTERPPFPADSPLQTLHRLASAQPTSVRLLNPRISPDLERIIVRCLEKDPAKRYQTYGSLLEDLGTALAAPRREWILPTTAAAGLALLGAILAAVFMVDAPTPPPAPVIIRQEIAIPVPAPDPSPAPPAPPVAPEPRIESAPVEVPALALPSKHELETAERLLALSRESLADRNAYEFERAHSRLASFLRKEEPTPWVKGLADAELERLRAGESIQSFFKVGETISLTLRSGRVVAGTLVASDRREVVVEIAGGLREAFPRTSIAPATYGPDLLVARAGAADARGVLPRLGTLNEHHAWGIVDQAIEEALQADLQELASFRVSDDLRDRLSPLLAGRFRLLDEESEAARLHLSGDFAKLFLERPLTRAGRRAAATVLDEFRKSMAEDPDLELVGEIPWGTWSTEGSARFDPAGRSYILFAAKADERAWIRKPFRGARHGYEVRFRLQPLEARLAVALSFTRWFEISSADFLLWAAETDQPPRRERRVELGSASSGGTLTVFPKAPLVLVYLDGRLLAALPEGEFALGDGMQLGAGRGRVVLESIRIKDRTR